MKLSKLVLYKKCFVLILCLLCNHLFAEYKDSTLFKRGQYTQYVLLPDSAGLTVPVHRVVLQRPLLYSPEQINLNIEVYNIWFKNHLAVFSLMPSYKNVKPAWEKIDLDSIKGKIITLKKLDKIIDSEITHFDIKRYYNNLKHYNLILIKEQSDGWYCCTTDCLSDFFEIIDDTKKTNNRAYQINISAPQLSVAEYETYYRRKHDSYSTNNRELGNWGYNEDVANGDILYQSFSEVRKEQKQYHFWLLSDPGHDRKINVERGTERFIFVPGKGIIAASYDFFMPSMVSYWLAFYNKKYHSIFKPQAIPAVNNSMHYPPLEDYFTEYVIKEAPPARKIPIVVPKKN